MKNILSTKLEPITIPFSLANIGNLLILILISVREYEQNKKETSCSDYKMILLKI